MVVVVVVLVVSPEGPLPEVPSLLVGVPPPLVVGNNYCTEAEWNSTAVQCRQGIGRHKVGHTGHSNHTAP